MSDQKLFLSPEKSTWCPGCGDFGILAAIKGALASLDLYPHQILVVSGIGCGSKLPHYLRANGFNSLHGRGLPIATGAHLGNHSLKVIAVTGDGDGYGMGGGHLIHTMRRNPDITHIVQNNQVYGLTKGQYSPTSDRGYVSSTSPEGSLEFAISPLALGIAAGATFLARGFSGEPKPHAAMIARGIQHSGYALIDVLQPCVTFNKLNSYDWYRERVYKVEEETGYDPTDRLAAWKKAEEWGNRIPTGVIYEDTSRPTYEEQVPVLRAGPLAKQPVGRRTPAEGEALKREFM
jgi:2-oxoglutarate ferredoxin oxidoreductase subunit beta